MSRGLGEVGTVVEHLPAMLEDTGSIPLYNCSVAVLLQCEFSKGLCVCLLSVQGLCNPTS